MYGWSASVCVRRNAAASEFIWCIYTHQCVFVEVQWIVSSYGEYTHSSVCVRRSAAYRDRVHMVYTPSSVSQAELVLLLAYYEVPIVHKSSI